MTPTKFHFPNAPEAEEDTPLNTDDGVGFVVVVVLMALATAFSYLVLDHFVGQAAGYVGAAATFLGIAYGIYRIIK